MGKGLKQTFLQRRYTNGQKAHEKMLNITYLYRNVNEIHKMLLQTHQKDIFKSPENNKYQPRCRETGPLASDENAKWYSSCGKWYTKFSNKLKNYNSTQQFHLKLYTRKNFKQDSKDFQASMFTQYTYNSKLFNLKHRKKTYHMIQ